MKKLVVITLFATLACCFTMVPLSVAEPIEMVIAHHFPNDISNNEVHLSMLRFKEQVQAGTNGGIRVKIFPNMTLRTEVG